MLKQVLQCKFLLAPALALLIAGSQLVGVIARADDTAMRQGNVTLQAPDDSQQLASWGLDIGFIQNGPRSGVELQVNAPRFASPWIPQFGLSMQSIDIEGHMLSSTSTASEVRSAGYLALAAKFQNPYTRGPVRPYSVLKFGALLTSGVATYHSVGAGYLGIGGEFLFNELVQRWFSHEMSQSTMAFFIELGVPIAGDQVQANSMVGSPYVFTGISTTIGFKYSL